MWNIFSPSSISLSFPSRLDYCHGLVQLIRNSQSARLLLKNKFFQIALQIAAFEI